MTALKPLETHLVAPVETISRYPLNEICAAPNCDKPTESAHHIWARSFLKSDPWFVSVEGVKGGYGKGGGATPNVVGLCGSGTTGCHGKVELHEAWIRLEDGVFVWYDRDDKSLDARDSGQPIWREVGALNPQPGSREGKPKRRKKASTPEERKARVNTTIRTPKGEENVIPELVEAVREKYAEDLGWTETVPPYFVVTLALAKALQ